MKHGPWSEEDFARAKRLRAQRLSYRQVGIELNRTTDSVVNKLASKDHVGRFRAHIEPGQSVKPSQVALAERDRRLADDKRDLTAKLMGDPLPGHSMLDKQRDRSLIDDAMRKKIQAQSDEAGA